MISWFIDFNKKSTALGHIILASDQIEKSHGMFPFEMNTKNKIKTIRDAVNQAHQVLKNTHRNIGLKAPSWIGVAAYASMQLCKNNPPRGTGHSLDVLLVSKIIRDFLDLGVSSAEYLFILEQFEELLEQYPTQNYLE